MADTNDNAIAIVAEEKPATAGEDGTTPEDALEMRERRSELWEWALKQLETPGSFNSRAWLTIPAARPPPVSLLEILQMTR